jgi:hypothetical protein
MLVGYTERDRALQSNESVKREREGYTAKFCAGMVAESAEGMLEYSLRVWDRDCTRWF